MNQNKGLHLKGLNGIRAIAALTVVVSHVITKISGFGMPVIKDYWDFSAYGVTMFFALSGFLITYLLLLEKAAYNTVNIKNFYVRRVLRIWPLYYLYLFIALLFAYFYFRNSLSTASWLYVFLMANVVNAIHASTPLLAHFWSLGVEEQFYLFWPWLIKNTHPLKTVVIFTIAFLLVKFALRMAAPHGTLYELIYATRFDCMSLGAMGAIVYYSNAVWFRKIVFHPVVQGISWIILATSVKLFKQLPDIITHELIACITVVIIINAAFNNKCLVSLENRIFDFLGKISFGIYVYHILVIFLLQLVMPGLLTGLNAVLQMVIIFMAVITVTIITAYWSYRYFESPFLKLKYKFSKVASHS